MTPAAIILCQDPVLERRAHRPFAGRFIFVELAERGGLKSRACRTLKIRRRPSGRHYKRPAKEKYAKFRSPVYLAVVERAACIRVSVAEEEERSVPELIWALLFLVSFFRGDVRLCFPCL